MGDHRADRRGPRRLSETPQRRATGARVAPKRAASRAERAGRVEQTAPKPGSHSSRGSRVAAAPAPRPTLAPTTATAQRPDVPPALGRPTTGKRRATSRRSAVPGLPSLPVLAGVATVAIAALGALSAVQAPSTATTDRLAFTPASALSGSSASSSSNLLSGRGQDVSRGASRDALAGASEDKLVVAAEAQAKQRDATLAEFAQQAEKQAAKIKLNAWVYPTSPVSLTAHFGEYGLWASYHTGLDFNGSTGQSIMAIAGGVVTSAGYDGSYGYKTVVTLDDGTEIWYAHQTSIGVSVGETVRAGQVIGTVGATGNVTGSHLHVEVRPGGGDPVDPYAAMVVHGLF